jgi:Fe2+ or Zn2+ uptake regulation protein
MITLFNELKQPVSVEQLKILLKKKGLSVNKTTIYREIVFLLDQKIILEVDLREGKKRYEPAKLGHHHHLVCGKCKTIEEIAPNEAIEEEILRIAKNHSYKSADHFFEIIGLCPKCS